MFSASEVYLGRTEHRAGGGTGVSSRGGRQRARGAHRGHAPGGQGRPGGLHIPHAPLRLHG
eukprot:465102-Pelagomonas_calceolata.AAC.3